MSLKHHWASATAAASLVLATLPLYVVQYEADSSQAACKYATRRTVQKTGCYASPINRAKPIDYTCMYEPLLGTVNPQKPHVPASYPELEQRSCDRLDELGTIGQSLRIACVIQCCIMLLGYIHIRLRRLVITSKQRVSGASFSLQSLRSQSFSQRGSPNEPNTLLPTVFHHSIRFHKPS